LLRPATENQRIKASREYSLSSRIAEAYDPTRIRVLGQLFNSHPSIIIGQNVFFFRKAASKNGVSKRDAFYD